MKRKNLIFVMILVLSGLLAMQSCKKEEPVPFTEHGAFTVPALVAPANGGFLNVAGSTVVLNWESTSASGDPQNWDVYFGNTEDPAKIQTGYTSESVTVNVTPGNKYYWKVVGTDANGIITRSELWSFEVVDPNAPLKLKMSWTTDAADAIGITLPPEDVVNLRLLIVPVVTSPTPVIVNSAGFEEYNDLNTLPDGTYLIETDIASTINAGDFNAPVNISINLQSSQRGIFSTLLAFPNVMTNEFACSDYKTVLAKITKLGSAYTIESAVSYITPAIITWNGTDADYPSEVTTSLDCAGNTMTGLGFGWMLDYWGEIIISGGTLSYTATATTVTIPLQKYCITTYNGAKQPEYSVQGSGTIDNSGEFPVWTIHYDFIQGGVSITAAIKWPTPYFEAVITTNPAGKGLSLPFPKIPKPTRK